ncbi:glutamate-5-semialdehyde dehydrogenase [Dongia sp.]|uniref:glutamate-5-semialdehyde dehydrogenase n=1 Tax=Dongia sp. TaxID=1977262 RepID=UPI0034A2D27A
MTALKKDAGVDGLMGEMLALGRAAKSAAAKLALAPREKKDLALKAMAAEIRVQAAKILAANDRDMKAAQARGLSSALLDRLLLDAKRVEAMATGLEEIAQLPDPVGRSLGAWERPNGLKIERVSVPLGVIGIIYESRPNVTADAAGLCLKSGNAAILRGGSESAHSAAAILDCLQEGLCAAGLPKASVQRLPTTDRAAVGIMLGMTESIDLIIPRGGKGLIERVANESRIPVLKHLDGICHTYVDGEADPEMARKIVANAKMRRTGICGATETLLIDRPALAFAKPILDDLIKAGCELRGDAAIQSLDKRVAPASPEDWDTEYLDAILSVRVVDGVDGAIEHIERHSSHHTEAIVTRNAATAARFLNEIDSGIVIWNSSTQFADGGEFGMGAEIGISTGKLHARGPVGAEQLTSYKYIVRGDGQVRP